MVLSDFYSMLSFKNSQGGVADELEMIVYERNKGAIRMKKVLILFGLAVFFLVFTFAGGLIDHGDIGSAILVLLSLPCLCLGFLYPKGFLILLMLAASFLAAGAGWAFWRRHMFLAMIPGSCSYLFAMIGLFKLKGKISWLLGLIKLVL